MGSSAVVVFLMFWWPLETIYPKIYKGLLVWTTPGGNLPGEAFPLKEDCLVGQEWCWAAPLPPVAWVAGTNELAGRRPQTESEGRHHRGHNQHESKSLTLQNSKSRPWKFHMCHGNPVFTSFDVLPLILKFCRYASFTHLLRHLMFSSKELFLPSAFLLCDPLVAVCHPLAPVIAQLPISENTSTRLPHQLNPRNINGQIHTNTLEYINMFTLYIQIYKYSSLGQYLTPLHTFNHAIEYKSYRR